MSTFFFHLVLPITLHQFQYFNTNLTAGSSSNEAINAQNPSQNWEFNPTPGPSSFEGNLYSTTNNVYDLSQNPAGNNEYSLTKIYSMNNLKLIIFKVV